MLLDKAKKILESGDYTCVLTNDSYLYTSNLRGVKPLVQLLETKTSPTGLFAADKVVGKATAYLYVLLKIQALYTKVISEPALTVLQAHNIVVQYDTLVANIINRKGDGICPFEEAVMGTHEPNEAYVAIRKKMESLNIRLTP